MTVPTSSAKAIHHDNHHLLRLARRQVHVADIGMRRDHASEAKRNLPHPRHIGAGDACFIGQPTGGEFERRRARHQIRKSVAEGLFQPGPHPVPLRKAPCLPQPSG